MPLSVAHLDDLLYKLPGKSAAEVAKSAGVSRQEVDALCQRIYKTTFHLKRLEIQQKENDQRKNLPFRISQFGLRRESRVSDFNSYISGAAYGA